MMRKYNGISTLEKNMAVSYKTKYMLSKQPSNCTLRHLFQEKKINYVNTKTCM